jgi:hypothetical protein
LGGESRALRHKGDPFWPSVSLKMGSEGFPPGLSWNEFRARYAKENGKTSQEEIATEWARYKGRKGAKGKEKKEKVKAKPRKPKEREKGKEEEKPKAKRKEKESEKGKGKEEEKPKAKRKEKESEKGKGKEEEKVKAKPRKPKESEKGKGKEEEKVKAKPRKPKESEKGKGKRRAGQEKERKAEKKSRPRAKPARNFPPPNISNISQYLSAGYSLGEGKTVYIVTDSTHEGSRVEIDIKAINVRGSCLDGKPRITISRFFVDFFKFEDTKLGAKVRKEVIYKTEPAGGLGHLKESIEQLVGALWNEERPAGTISRHYVDVQTWASLSGGFQGIHLHLSALILEHITAIGDFIAASQFNVAAIIGGYLDYSQTLRVISDAFEAKSRQLPGGKDGPVARGLEQKLLAIAKNLFILSLGLEGMLEEDGTDLGDEDPLASGVMLLIRASKCIQRGTSSLLALGW